VINGALSSVTAATLDVAALQDPLATTARNAVTTLSGAVKSGLLVEPTSSQVAPPSSELCQLTIFPVCPSRLMLLPVPLDTGGLSAAAVPPTARGSTTSETLLELVAGLHVPLTTQAYPWATSRASCGPTALLVSIGLVVPVKLATPSSRLVPSRC